MSIRTKPLHVAVGVIVGRDGRVLLGRRADHQHQGGLWEFPGGKVEAGEEVATALSRELDEELGLSVRRARPLIRIPFAYPDRTVLLDVWRVEDFVGEPHGREGQPLAWVAADALAEYRFPAANRPIVTAARLPEHYLITPDPGPRESWPGFLARLERSLDAGIRLVQLRAKGLPEGPLVELARQAVALAHRYRASLLVNGRPELAMEAGADGVHLNGTALAWLRERPLPMDRWVAASCHDERQLRQAAALAADFAVVSPVRRTHTHPQAEPIGWEGLHRLCEMAAFPVYALGGLQSPDVEHAWRHGAQGIAAIRGLWDGVSPATEAPSQHGS